MTILLGIKHGMATQPFETVQKARDLRKHKGWTVRRIAKHMGLNYHTVESWIYYRTRVGA